MIEVVRDHLGMNLILFLIEGSIIVFRIKMGKSQKQGGPMVSSEDVCASLYMLRRLRRENRFRIKLTLVGLYDHLARMYSAEQCAL